MISVFTLVIGFQMSSNKIILVTGCTRGMGRKLVEYFANHCKIVIGVGHAGEHMNALKRELGGNPKCKFYPVEVSNLQQVESLADQLRALNMVPDILINNAAVLGPVKPIWEVTEDEFCKTMQINVQGVFNFMHAFMPLMKDKQGAVIVNISSGWGRTVCSKYSTYCTSKWAVEGLTKAAAADCENTQMAVVSIAPGVVDTDMLHEAGITQKGVPLDDWVKTFPNMVVGLNKQNNGQQLSFEQGGRESGL